jgi:alpha-L-rhamnosidase
MKQFLIKPKLVGDLSYAKTTSGSLYGSIVSNWKREGSTGTFEIEVPPNTTARVYLPAKTVDDIREGGQPLSAAAGVKHLGAENGCQVLAVQSGRYLFTSLSVPEAAAQ